jgi:hypothetical protein
MDKMAAAKEAALAYRPSLYDITRFFEHNYFVGDEKNRLSLVIGLLGRQCVGVESLSGSGKTVMSDTALKLFDPSWIYTMGLQSKTAAFYEANEIVKRKLIYIPELQKALDKSGLAIEILKNFGEGKDIDRPVTDIAHKTTRHYKIPWRPYIYTLATENETVPDAELSRRVLKLSTDITAEQTGKVLEMKAMREFNPDALRVLTDLEEFAIKSYMQLAYRMAMETYTQFQFVNPYSIFIQKSIPRSFVQARTAIDHYANMTKAVAKFFAPAGKRYIQDNRIFCTLADNWFVNQIYGEAFTYDVMQMPPHGRFVVRVLREASRPMMLSDIQNEMREAGVTVKLPVLKEIIEMMIAAGYAFTDSSNKMGGYILSPIVTEFERKTNWRDAHASAQSMMKKVYPEAYEAWEATCEKEVIDPIKGTLVNIFDWKSQLKTIDVPKEARPKTLAEFVVADATADSLN